MPSSSRLAAESAPASGSPHARPGRRPRPRRGAVELAGIPEFVDLILVVDDASSDGTAAAVRSSADERVELVSRERNGGVGAAIVTGYQRALEEDLDVVCVMAGDKQGIKLRKVVPQTSWLLVKGFFWRLREKYVIRDFHPLVCFYAFRDGSGFTVWGRTPLGKSGTVANRT